MIADVKLFMTHDLSQFNLDLIEIGWGPATQEKDEVLLNRLCDYFALRMEKEPMFLSDTMWEGNVQRQKDVIQLLQDRDIDGLHDNLKNLFSSSITHGTTQGKDYTESLQALDETSLKRDHGLYVYDKLLDVMEYAGIITAYSPEEYFWVKDFNVFHTTAEFHLEVLMNTYKLDLNPPKNQGMLFGLDTKFGVYSIKDIHAIGLALMLRDKFKEHDPSTLKICEIGGGAGQFAYYMHKLGFTDYTIVDIPTVSVSQMYYLGTNIGLDKVKHLSPDEFDGKYDIVINVDSMPEMSEQSARTYINTIAANSKYFLSINQERLKFTVNNLCSEKNMYRLSRNPFWFRKGYLIEEFMNK